jgi:hypothetical protein
VVAALVEPVLVSLPAPVVPLVAVVAVLPVALPVALLLVAPLPVPALPVDPLELALVVELPDDVLPPSSLSEQLVPIRHIPVRIHVVVRMEGTCPPWPEERRPGHQNRAAVASARLGFHRRATILRRMVE